jgi:hypothetical protein
MADKTMAETQEQTWDVLGYTHEPPRRIYRSGLTRDQIKGLREDEYLRAYHMMPASGDARHEAWLRDERGSEQFINRGVRNFLFGYYLDLSNKRIPTREDVERDRR